MFVLCRLSKYVESKKITADIKYSETKKHTEELQQILRALNSLNRENERNKKELWWRVKKHYLRQWIFNWIKWICQHCQIMKAVNSV